MGSTRLTILAVVYICIKMSEKEKKCSNEDLTNSTQGGVTFDVLIEEAKSNEKPSVTTPTATATTVEEIERKLKRVELRRKSMEASTLEKLAEKLKKGDEVRAKRASMLALNE